MYGEKRTSSSARQRQRHSGPGHLLWSRQVRSLEFRLQTGIWAAKDRLEAELRTTGMDHKGWPHPTFLSSGRSSRAALYCQPYASAIATARVVAERCPPTLSADHPIPVIDLFAGPGGLGEGFSALGRPEGRPRFSIRLTLIHKSRIAAPGNANLLIGSFPTARCRAVHP